MFFGELARSMSLEHATLTRAPEVTASTLGLLRDDTGGGGALESARTTTPFLESVRFHSVVFYQHKALSDCDSRVYPHAILADEMTVFTPV